MDVAISKGLGGWIGVLALALMCSFGVAFGETWDAAIEKGGNVSLFSYDWVLVGSDWVLPQGLEVRIAMDGSGVRMARVPDLWSMEFVPRFTKRKEFRVKVWVQRQSIPKRDIPVGLASQLQAPMDCIRFPEQISESADSLDLFRMGRKVWYYDYDFRDERCECLFPRPCSRFIDAIDECMATPSTRNCTALKVNWWACGHRCSSYADPITQEISFGPSRQLSLESELADCGSVHMIPGRAEWCRCKNCAIDHTGTVLLFSSLSSYSSSSPELKTDREVDKKIWEIAASRHAPYWTKPGRGKIRARLHQVPYHCDRIIRDPVVVASVWSINNMYHLITDLAQPVHAMLFSRGIDPTNAILLLDIGHPEENALTQRFLKSLRDRADTPMVAILGRLFRHRVYSLDAIPRLGGTTCFADLHVGIDVSETPHEFAFRGDYSESVLGLRPTKIHHRQIEFNYYIAPRKPLVSSSSRNVLIVNRRHNRRIVNLAQLKQQFRALLPKSNAGWIKDVVLERVPFSKQLELFSETDIFVCVHGQGCANLIFLRKPGASVLLIMPSKFLGWKWMYANLAIGSGLEIRVLGDPNDTPNHGWNGTDTEFSQSNHQGFHIDRDQDIAFPISIASLSL